jgi:anti-sigma regulatory factor (Ser/Thr protein kinase)
MPTVRLSFTPAPAHLRTVRLVAVAVARLAGVPAERYDEIRLAVGEACSRAVAVHQRHGLDDLVEVVLSGDARFTIQVRDHGPAEADLPDETPDPVALLAHSPDGGDRSDEERVAVGVRLTLLSGIVDQLAVRPATDGPGTEVQMTWPITGR